MELAKHNWHVLPCLRANVLRYCHLKLTKFRDRWLFSIVATKQPLRYCRRRINFGAPNPRNCSGLQNIRLSPSVDPSVPFTAKMKTKMAVSASYSHFQVSKFCWWKALCLRVNKRLTCLHLRAYTLRIMKKKSTVWAYLSFLEKLEAVPEPWVFGNYTCQRTRNRTHNKTQTWQLGLQRLELSIKIWKL